MFFCPVWAFTSLVGATRAVVYYWEQLLVPSNHTISINGFLLLKRTAVSPGDGALFCLAALLIPHQSTEEFSKTWSLSTAGLRGLEGSVCRR